LVGAVGFDANLNSSFSRYYVQNASNYPSMLKTDEFQQLYIQSRQSIEYDPAKVQKMIRYLFDNALVTPLYAIKRGDVLQTYVHDTGFYTKQAWPGWNPSDVWLSKK
jgi:hypothetical protein